MIIGKSRHGSRIVSLLLVALSVFFIMSGEFIVRARAAESTVLYVAQSFRSGNSIAAISGEQFINELAPIKYLTIAYGNSEHHWYCDNCGAKRSSTTTTINIYGYKKSDGSQVALETYSLSGLNGSSRKTATAQMMITDTIKETYSYLKVAASMSGCTTGNCSCDASHSYFTNGTGYANITATTYDEPVIQSGGNLTDKTLIEGVSDYIGIVNAYFPSGQESYTWQYSEGNGWVSLIDGTTLYNTASHGKFNLTDKNGGTSFSTSNMIKMIDPEASNSGIKLRVIINSTNSAASTTSETAVITVKSRTASGFYSARYATRYGQVGEKVLLSDVISYAKFDNGQIVEVQKLLESDAARVAYYGFVEPEDKSLSIERTLEGLKNGSVKYTELGADSAYLNIREGDNTFYIKFSYGGGDNTDSYAAVMFAGKDENPPVFEENVELYEHDGMTLYTRGDYAILYSDETQSLKISGSISDSVSDTPGIRWAYTLSETKNKEDLVSIPVYRTGNHIDLNVTKNGKYILYAEDDSGNAAQKIIIVKAFDENDPVMKCTVTGIPGVPGGTVYSSLRIDVQASDAERLKTKPYLYKYFKSVSDANAYNPLSASESDYVASNSYAVSESGYYLVAVQDAVGRITKEILTIPANEGEIVDSISPEIVMTPLSVRDAKGTLTEYNISISDNNAIKGFSIKLKSGDAVVEQTHNHGGCASGSCSEMYHFIPDQAGDYRITVTDMAGNTSSASFSVGERVIEDIEVTGISESMSVNSEVSLKNIIDGSRIILKMSDGTTDIYSGSDDVLVEMMDGSGNPKEKITIGYGENVIKFVVTVNKGTDREKKYEYTQTVIGEDNVAPLPGQMQTIMTEGWDGSLTNDLSKQITLSAAGYEDDGSNTDNLVITWYLDDVEVQKKTVGEGGNTYGPFSGEEANGTYRYTVTDENGNTAFSTFEKTINSWDTTAPTGEVKLLPEGVSSDSKARFKQIQIVNASDDQGLAEKPFSFHGDSDERYGVIGSVVAGENGNYEIYIRDCAGNVTHLGDYNLTGIDSIAPTINGYEVLDGDDGKKILHVDATDNSLEDSDDGNGLSYSLDGENYQNSPDFEIDESGIYTIYVKDETGNITKTSTEYTDTEAPSISASQDESGAGVIIVNVSDNVGLSRVVMDGPDGTREILQVYDGVTEDTIRKEIGKIGEYRVTVTDMAGNTQDASVNISSIAAACSSSILTGLKITPSGWTNGDVTIIAQLSDTQGLSSAPFRWNNSIATAQPYMIMTENGDAKVDICDRYGNSIASQTITISNIDRTAPVLGDLIQSEDKNHLIINVSDKGSGLSQITISGGPYSVETGAVTLNGDTDPDEIKLTLPTNGTYTVRAYDRAGNSCQKQISVDGVTTDIAKVEYKEVVKEVEKIVPEEKIVTETQTVTITQEVEKAVPILVPIPTTETVIKYKTIRENGEDTSVLINGGDQYIEGENSETIITNETDGENSVDTEVTDNEKNLVTAADTGLVGEYTKDGTYIAPDGYEYYNRVDQNLKNEHPFKYWFKKNAEKIAVAACILAIIFLILCIIMGVLLTKDYFKEQRDKSTIRRLRNGSGKNE